MKSPVPEDEAEILVDDTDALRKRIEKRLQLRDEIFVIGPAMFHFRDVPKNAGKLKWCLFNINGRTAHDDVRVLSWLMQSLPFVEHEATGNLNTMCGLRPFSRFLNGSALGYVQNLRAVWADGQVAARA